MIVFEIHCKFFFVLLIQQKTCRCNGFLYFMRKNVCVLTKLNSIFHNHNTVILQKVHYKKEILNPRKDSNEKLCVISQIYIPL